MACGLTSSKSCSQSFKVGPHCVYILDFLLSPNRACQPSGVTPSGGSLQRELEQKQSQIIALEDRIRLLSGGDRAEQMPHEAGRAQENRASLCDARSFFSLGHESTDAPSHASAVSRLAPPTAITMGLRGDSAQ
eukprot:1898090-Amphidinium_carterae.1